VTIFRSSVFFLSGQGSGTFCWEKHFFSEKVVSALHLLTKTMVTGWFYLQYLIIPSYRSSKVVRGIGTEG